MSIVDRNWAGKLPPPKSDELELLQELPDYEESTSPLSCQIEFTETLDGLRLAIAPDT